MSQDRKPASSSWISLAGCCFAVFGAVAGFFLVYEHRAHALGWFPWLLFLACPVMHLLMRRHHPEGRHEP